jgi:hypothetical protein
LHSFTFGEFALIIYRGPSLIDGKPIVCIVVFPKGKSNSKTGPMLQSYVLADNGYDPMHNNKTGEDYSICGNCPHRGTPTDNPDKKTATGRVCYVNLMHGPGQVYKAFKRDKYPTAQTSDDIAKQGTGRMVRMGSYGDPLAVPKRVWDALTSKALGHTGYTHQSGRMGASGQVLAGSSYLMLSADSKEQAQQAWTNGMRTFRIIPINAKPSEALDPYNEIMCPSDKIQCVQCGLCKGSNKGKSVAIVAHGIGKNYIK